MSFMTVVVHMSRWILYNLDSDVQSLDVSFLLLTLHIVHVKDFLIKTIRSSGLNTAITAYYIPRIVTRYQ